MVKARADQARAFLSRIGVDLTPLDERIEKGAEPCRGTRKAAPPSLIERDILEALARLVAGKPTNPELKRLAARGRLSVNVSRVAKEAGRSRTLIAHEGCRYPAVRLRVLEHMRPVANPRHASAVIAALCEEVAGEGGGGGRGGGGWGGGEGGTAATAGWCEFGCWTAAKGGVRGGEGEECFVGSSRDRSRDLL